MDALMCRFDAVPDGDLLLCAHRGIAYQADMKAGRVCYDADYLAKVDAYEDTDIARAVNAGRCALVSRHVKKGATVLDIGAGSGAFVSAALNAGFAAKGMDVIPQANARLQAADRFAADPQSFEAVTFWDALEHMEDPALLMQSIKKGAMLFASIPLFIDLNVIRRSKHHRPGEHLYYWTAAGFIAWIALYGFRLLEESAHETEAGRENIGAFAFCRDLPDYHDHIAAYKEIHASRYYGGSATELHLADVAALVRDLRPASILDYGCGRSDLAAHFYLDGRRHITHFDPAIPAFEMVPEGRFDLVLACDLMEHVPMASVDRVLAHIKTKGDTVLFTISTKPARAKLPDGRNAHVTLLTRSEWTRWLEEIFGSVKSLPSQWEHELVLLAGRGRSVAA